MNNGKKKLNMSINKKKEEPSFIYKPILAKAHTPPYKIHKYFARRPHNAFSQLINNYSRPGEKVLDPFCGGGVTIYEGIIRGRKMIGCDLNPLSIFIVRNMIKRSSLSKNFKISLEEIRKYLSYLQGEYMCFEKEGKTYNIDWAEMALSVRCPFCGNPTPLSNKLKIKATRYNCQNQYCKFSSEKSFIAKDCERSEFMYLSLIHNTGKQRVEKEYDVDDDIRYREHIKFLKSELSRNNVTVPKDLIPLEWDRQFEDGLVKKGIYYFQDLFTKRNLYILLLLLNKIKSYCESLENDEYELLRMIFSNIVKDTNIMSFTNEGWQSGKPTTWSKHAFWIPNQFCEVAIAPTLEKAIKRIVDTVEYNKKIKFESQLVKKFKDLKNDIGNVLLYNQPVSITEIPENSIDAIITDPPYGSNVQYLELSHFWYPWNNDMYERYPVFELEAIYNRKKGFKGAKDQYKYEHNLKTEFNKAYACLKPQRYMTLTFNNKDMSSWLALLFSIFSAGFSFVDMYFQDGVKNYKQTAHTKAKGSPYGDFIYVFQKNEFPQQGKAYISEAEFIEHIDNLFSIHMENEKNQNDAILAAFKSAIPLIAGFVYSYLNNNTYHSLYTHFNKNYLSKFEAKHNEDK